MKKTIKEIHQDFEDEFGIHFKDSKGELGFAKAFITEAIKEAFEAVEINASNTSYEKIAGGGEYSYGYKQAKEDQKENMKKFLNEYPYFHANKFAKIIQDHGETVVLAYSDGTTMLGSVDRNELIKLP